MKRYPYRRNRRTRYLTAIHIFAVMVLAVVMALLYEGGYLSAWFLSLALAFVALTVLSIPKNIALDDSTLYIRCILDITEIPFADIVTVRPVGKRDMRWVFPIFGCYGFFGYFGHFVDMKNMRHLEFYASTWGNFVEITTIYEKTYIVSCEERDELVAILRQNKPHRDTMDEI